MSRCPTNCGPIRCIAAVDEPSAEDLHLTHVRIAIKENLLVPGSTLDCRQQAIKWIGNVWIQQWSLHPGAACNHGQVQPASLHTGPIAWCQDHLR